MRDEFDKSPKEGKMNRKIEGFVCRCTVYGLLAFGFVLFVIIGDKKNGVLKILIPINDYLIAWSQKHHLVMLCFGATLLCLGAFSAPVLSAFLFVCGVPYWKIILAISLAVFLAQRGSRVMMIALHI